MFSMFWTRCTFWTNLPLKFFTEDMLLFFNITRKPCRWKLLALHGLLWLFTHRTSENFSVFVKSRVAGLFGETSHMQVSRATFGLFWYSYSCKVLKHSGYFRWIFVTCATAHTVLKYPVFVLFLLFNLLVPYKVRGRFYTFWRNALNVQFSVLNLYKVCNCSKMEQNVTSISRIPPHHRKHAKT